MRTRYTSDTMTNIKLPTKTRKMIRSAAKASGTPWPIVVVEGDGAPKVAGGSFHWTTKTGQPIYHPNAYSKVGQSSMVYHHSTLRIEVGRDWLWANGVRIYATCEGQATASCN